MNVTEAIASLLYEHNTVIVPALGAFVRNDESAQVNVITNEFQRPSSSVSFDPSQHEENPLLMDYLMLYGELSDEDARQQIAAFVADCYAKMREGETVTLEGIGNLRFNNLQEPVFEPDSEADFNTEAFGLEDLEAKPVYRVEPIQVEPAQDGPAQDGPAQDEPAHDLQETPVIEKVRIAADSIVEFKPVEEPRHHIWWLWLLLLLAAGGVALWYFQFKPVEPNSPVVTIDTNSEAIPETVSEAILDTVSEVGSDTLALLTADTSKTVADPVAISAEEVSITPAMVPSGGTPTEVVKPNPESKAFIVGGCFSVEENALNMAMEAYGQGCKGAFVMKRGSKFFVCYGQYLTNDDAKAALPEILEKYNSKAWILIK